EYRLAALPERGVEVQLRAVKREGRFPVEKWAVDYGAALRLIHRVQVSRRSPWIRGTCPSRDPDVHGGLAWRARHAAIGIRRRTGSEAKNISRDRKSTRLNSSHLGISYAVFCLKKKKKCNLKQSNYQV